MTKESNNIFRWRPRIRMVLLAVNTVILLMPLVGIQALHLYQNELIQRTESSVLAQATLVREMFRAEILASLAMAKIETKGDFDFGLPVLPQYRQENEFVAGRYQPILPHLTMINDRIRPPLLDAEAATMPSDPIVATAAQIVQPLIRNAQLYNLSGIRLTDYRGIVVGTTGAELDMSILNREAVYRALTGENVRFLQERLIDTPAPKIETISRGTLVRVVVAMPVTFKNRVLGVVLMSRTPMDLTKALYQNRFVLARYLAGLIVLVIIVSFFTATTIIKPIQALIDQAKRVGKDPTSAAIPIERPGSHEIKLLSAAIAEMATTLQERAQYIESFARNVSHEFKTPIASIKGSVEIFKDHFEGMSKAERNKFLNMLEHDANRMEQLVNRLLQLARADVAKPTNTNLKVNQELSHVMHHYLEQGLNIHFENSLLDRHLIRVSDDDFISIISNLVDNSVQHGGSTVEINVKARVSDSRVIIEVQDDGPGISEDNLDRVFTAFFTTNRDAGGTGLGLPIVKALVSSYEGELELTSSGAGTRVRVTLPLV
jgi:signal transduction histidine kinase